MNSLKKIILLLAILSVTICAYFLKTSYDNKKQNSKENNIQLVKVDKKDINSINIENEKGSFLIKINDNKYEISNFNYKFDNSLIEDIVTNLSNIQALRLISSNKEDYKRFGLDNPKGKATINLKSGKTINIYLGDKLIDGNSYYAAFDDKIYTISDSIGEKLLKSINDIRDKSIAFINGDLYEIKITKGKEVLQLKSEDGIRWFVAIPYGGAVSADNDKIYSIKETLNELYIEDFVEDNCKNLSKYGLNKPSLVVDVTLKNTKKSLIFGNKIGEDLIYFKTSDSNSVYTISLNTFNTFNEKPFDMVSKCPVNPLISSIESINIQYNNDKYNFKIKKEKDTSAKNKDEIKYIYELNGKNIKEEDFKNIYIKYCSLFIDSQINDTVKKDPEVIITFKLNEGLEKNIKIELIPYNDYFYKLIINGKGNFAISKLQIKDFINYIKDTFKDGQ